MAGGLGRRPPTDWAHVDSYPLRLAAVPLVVPTAVENLLPINQRYRARYDQGSEGACVGFSSSWMMSMLNHKLFDASWLYHEAQKVDEWPGEEYSGTSVRAGMDVLRTVGHRRVYNSKISGADPAEGIAENRWATTVDEVRASISGDIPVVIGVNWYTAFDTGQLLKRGREWWVTQNDQVGSVRGGHAICLTGASDRRQAVAWTNSWGTRYPSRVWLPYRQLERLLREDGEATLVTDRA